MRAYIPYI